MSKAELESTIPRGFLNAAILAGGRRDAPKRSWVLSLLRHDAFSSGQRIDDRTFLDTNIRRPTLHRRPVRGRC
jgi:hypothetical protein